MEVDLVTRLRSPLSQVAGLWAVQLVRSIQKPFCGLCAQQELMLVVLFLLVVV